MLEYCRKRGYGTPVAYHRIAWDKDWSLIWAETGGRVSLLMFLNDSLIKNVQADTAKREKAST